MESVMSSSRQDVYKRQSNECSENSKNGAGTIYKEIETKIGVYKKFLNIAITKKVMQNEFPGHHSIDFTHLLNPVSFSITFL